MKALFCCLAAILCLGILYSCTSPSDVPANRIIYKDPVLHSVPALEVTPKPVDFGTVPLPKLSQQPGTSASVIIRVTITNTSAVTTAITLKFKNGMQNFVIISPPLLPTSLPPQTSRKIDIRFTPVHPGIFTDALVVNDSISVPVIAYVPVANPAVWIEDADFGASSTASVKVKAVTIHNMGDAPASIINAVLVGGGASAFTLVDAASSLPIVLSSGQQIQTTIKFMPTTTGNYSAEIQLQIQYSGSGSVDNIGALTGIGE